MLSVVRSMNVWMCENESRAHGNTGKATTGSRDAVLGVCECGVEQADCSTVAGSQRDVPFTFPEPQLQQPAACRLG